MKPIVRTAGWLIAAALVAAGAYALWCAWPFAPEPRGPLSRVVTLAGAGQRVLPSPLADPFGVAVAPDGAIYVADGSAGQIFRVAADGAASGGGASSAALVASGLDMPGALAVAPDGALVVANTGGHTVARVDPATGAVSVLAGAPGEAGYADGPAATARFFGPVGVAVAPDGTVFVADTYNDRVRAIAPDGEVRTVAGGPEPGFADGPPEQARFDTPCGVAVAPDGAVVVADTGNNRVRRVAPDGAVTTLFGSGAAEEADGGAAEAAFDEPIALAFGVVVAPAQGGPAGEAATAPDGERPRVLVVADAGGSSVRLCMPGGEVRTLAGGFPAGMADGDLASARFNRPSGVAAAPDGTVVVADAANGLVRALVAEGFEGGLPAGALPPPLSPDEVRAAVAPRWPYDPPDARRELAATFGEIRGEREGGGEESVWLHNGIDVPGRYGETVVAMHSERVTRPIAVTGAGGPRERLRLPLFGYIHMRFGRDAEDRPFERTPFLFRRDERGRVVGVRVPRGARIERGEPIATLNNQNHVHLLAGPPGGELNLLEAIDLPGLVDTIAPVVVRVAVTDAGYTPIVEAGPGARREVAGRDAAAGGAAPAVASGRVRVLVEAYDRHDGNSPSRKLGVYRVEHQLLDPSGRPAPGFEAPRPAIVFDRMPDDPRAGRLVYAEGSRAGYSGATAFVYVATSPFGGGRAREDSIDLSALPPGDYVLRVTAADRFGNSSSLDVPLAVGEQNRAR